MSTFGCRVDSFSWSLMLRIKVCCCRIFAVLKGKSDSVPLIRISRTFCILGVLISHVAPAGTRRGLDFMVGHSNAGASDLDRPAAAWMRLIEAIPALEDSLHLSGIDPEWLWGLPSWKTGVGGRGKRLLWL